MNNLLSYCELVDTRISASERDLPVFDKFRFPFFYRISNNQPRNMKCTKRLKISLKRKKRQVVRTIQKKVVAKVHSYSYLQYKSAKNLKKCTLESGIEVGPMVINLAFFPGPTALLKALRLLISGIFLGPYSLHALFIQIFLIIVISL